MNALDRCLRHVYPDIVTGCWLWTGTMTRKGYGSFQKETRVASRAHRFVYEELKGAIPEGLVLDHLCRHRNCVNPDHLEPVTNAENCARGMTGKVNHRNAVKAHCPNGHPYNEENTYRRKPEGWRACRVCRRKVYSL